MMTVVTIGVELNHATRSRIKLVFLLPASILYDIKTKFSLQKRTIGKLQSEWKRNKKKGESGEWMEEKKLINRYKRWNIHEIRITA